MTVSLVTGASTGIGFATALRLAHEGHQVHASVRSEASGQALLDAAGDLDVSLVIMDVDHDDSVTAALEGLRAATGGVDVLVNNAGIGKAVSLEEEPLEWFESVMDINVTATWHLCKLFRDALIADGGGSIVNVASMLGHVGSTPVKQTSYCASKGAVVNLTRELALQLARRNVRVNALCPGWFQSEMTAGMETDEGAVAYLKANGPMPRMGDVDELDGALLLLSTEAGTFLTGQSIIVDGGWTAR
jgi:NAD(P)-dependent dehydrogenase (short-subunit alcohol dehydrogenase family)